MNSRRLLLLILPLMMAGCSLTAQTTFSQFYSSPLTVNPANTGKFTGDYRLGGVCRNENNSFGFSSAKAAFFTDMRILKSSLATNDKLAVGVAALAEKNVALGLKNSYLSFSLAYHKGLDEAGLQQVGVGFQINYCHQSLTSPTLIFEDQLLYLSTRGIVNTNPYGMQPVNITYPDLNIGLVYENAFDNRNTVSVGLSAFHVNRPNTSFNGGEFHLAPLGSLQLGWKRQSSSDDENALFSSLMVSNTKDKTLGYINVNFIYLARINQSRYKIGPGCSFRRDEFSDNALIPSIALYYEKFVFNISFDVNVSKQTSSQRRAAEASVIYTIHQKTKE